VCLLREKDPGAARRNPLKGFDARVELKTHLRLEEMNLPDAPVIG
jgi:hypothetical protein